jgi:hypothetical protein
MLAISGDFAGTPPQCRQKGQPQMTKQSFQNNFDNMGDL